MIDLRNINPEEVIRHFKTKTVPITQGEAEITRDLELKYLEERISDLQDELQNLAMSDLPTYKQVFERCEKDEATYSDYLSMGPKFILRDGKWEQEDAKPNDSP